MEEWKAMDVGQRPESEIQQKNHVERAIIMAAGTGTRMRPGNAYYAETADPCEGCPHD